MAEISDELAEENLWKCDCPDNGTHLNPVYHYYGCAFITWYAQKLRDLMDIEDEE